MKGKSTFLTIFIVLTLVALIAAPASARVRNLYIAATDGYAYLPATNEVPAVEAERYYIRGFCPDTEVSSAKPGCAQLPAPIIDVNQGDNVFITLRNIGNSNPLAPIDPHTIHLHGVHATTQNDGFPESSWELGDFEEGVYYFKAESPGTYMWHCHVEASEHVQMGMYGAMIIRPRIHKWKSVFGGFWNDRFDREYIVLLSDVDTAGHKFIEVGAPDPPDPDAYSFADFQADAWLVNGRAFPDTVMPATDPPAGCEPECNPAFSGPPTGYLEGSNNKVTYEPLVTAGLGQRILLRVINMGYRAVPWHVHGWHFRAVGKDARPIKRIAQSEEFTLNIGSGETYDLIIHATDRTLVGKYKSASNFYGSVNDIATVLGSYPGGTPGVPPSSAMDGNTKDYWFPMHSHDDFTVTNFGEYPGGQLSIIHVAPGL